MRFGFTTGSCAAAASKAAAYMLLSGRKKEKISIVTPKGIVFDADITDICITENSVSCAVKKDAGDDPDITDGTLVYAKVWQEEITAASDVTASDTDGAGNAEATVRTDNTISGDPEAAARNDNTISDNAESAIVEDLVNLGYISITDRNTESISFNKDRIRIFGGKGVGRVTQPGLDQPVGEAAINHVPRKMIKKEVGEVMGLFDHTGIINVEISVPEGEALADRTFNPRLGIVGGISILGTSGIVEPMSEQALIDTIRVELSVHHARGEKYIVVSPGNYGLDFIKNKYGFNLDEAVKSSNYIGDTVKYAADMGFEKMVLAGHIGKLVKVAFGMLNTHSKYGDHRMEVFAEEAAKEGIQEDVISDIEKCVSTDAAIDILKTFDASGVILKRIMNNILKRVVNVLEQVTGGKMKIFVIIFSNVQGLLAESEGAEALIGEIKKINECG
ncbi:MAG: cobalt-precorrin-5B (C(1))-methyltransferase CbiD [Eubacterium sp.]|nr:cobalt-precorrin-5B (C(1))-methyltransferase CbiD [Eubacterium sp.]